MSVWYKSNKHLWVDIVKWVLYTDHCYLGKPAYIVNWHWKNVCEAKRSTNAAISVRVIRLARASVWGKKDYLYVVKSKASQFPHFYWLSHKYTPEITDLLYRPVRWRRQPWAQIRGSSGLCRTHANQMRQPSSRTVHRFTRVYLHARTAVDAGDIRTWRTTVILITGKNPKTPNLSSMPE